MHGKKNEGRAPAADSAFGVRAPQPAPRAGTGAPRGGAAAPRAGAMTARQRVEAALADAAFAQLSVVDEKPGFDPYNSGSFDRKHAWARTHRR